MRIATYFVFQIAKPILKKKSLKREIMLVVFKPLRFLIA